MTQKQMSENGTYFYILGLATGDDGWVSQDPNPKDGQAILPFRFWRVRKGKRAEATDEDVNRYKQLWRKDERLWPLNLESTV